MQFKNMTEMLGAGYVPVSGYKPAHPAIGLGRSWAATLYGEQDDLGRSPILFEIKPESVLLREEINAANRPGCIVLAFAPQQIAEIEREATAIVPFDPRSAERLTEGQLDRIALEQVGVIGRIPIDRDCIEVGPLAGGWAAGWDSTRMCTDQLDTLVLIPADERTRALALEGDVRALTALGMWPEEAERLARAQIPLKRKVSRFVPEALKNVGAILLGGLNPDADTIRYWERKRISPDIIGLSERHKTALIECVAAATGMTWRIYHK